MRESITLSTKSYCSFTLALLLGYRRELAPVYIMKLEMKVCSERSILEHNLKEIYSSTGHGQSILMTTGLIGLVSCWIGHV